MQTTSSNGSFPVTGLSIAVPRVTKWLLISRCHLLVIVCFLLLVKTLTPKLPSWPNMHFVTRCSTTSICWSFPLCYFGPASICSWDTLGRSPGPGVNSHLDSGCWARPVFACGSSLAPKTKKRSDGRYFTCEESKHRRFLTWSSLKTLETSQWS